MKTFEIDNKSMATKYFLFLFFLIIFVGVFTIPKAYNLYETYPEFIEVSMPLKILMALTIGYFIYMLFWLKASLGRKIKIDDPLIYFMKRRNGGFGAWEIIKMFDLSSIDEISSRQKSVYAGKVAITYNWLIFKFKKGKTVELLINGWDFNSVKNLLYYIRGKFPKIILSNFLMKDSSEKISGLDEFIEENKKKNKVIKSNT